MLGQAHLFFEFIIFKLLYARFQIDKFDYFGEVLRIPTKNAIFTNGLTKDIRH